MSARRERRRATLRDRQAPRFALFGETLLTGVVVLVASIPLVTAVPAFAAGVRHLRRHATGESDSIRVLIGDLGQAIRRLWPLGAVVAVVAGFLLVDAWALGGMQLPAAEAITVVLTLFGAGATVVLLRFTGSWVPTAGVRGQLQRACLESWTDLIGSLLLLLAAGAAVVVVWMFPAFVLVSGGLLCLAAYGVDARLEAISSAE